MIHVGNLRALGGAPSTVLNGTVAASAAAVVIGLLVGIGVAVASPLYVFAGLVGAAAGLALFVNVEWALAAFVGVAAILPFGVIPIPLGTAKLTFLDVTLVALLLTLVFRLLGRRGESLVLTGAELPLVLFVAWSIFAFIVGTAYGVTTEVARLFVEWIGSTLFFVVAVNLIRSWRRAARVLATLGLGGSLAAALGITLYYLPSSTTVRLLGSLGRLGYPTSASDILQYVVGIDVLRATGTSINPNIFGALLMMAGVACGGLIFARRPAVPRAVLVVALVPILVCLPLTYSRGSIIGLAAGLGLIVFLRNRRLFLIGLAAVALVAVIGYATQWVLVTHFVSGLEAKDKAAAMRLGEYKDAFLLIQQYPIAGVGFSNPPDVNQYIGVSSMYLLLAEETGLVGLGLYLLTMGVVVVNCARRARRALGDAATLPLIALGALVAALVAGLFDHHFVDLQVPHMVALTWFLAALASVREAPGAQFADAPARRDQSFSSRVRDGGTG